MSHDAASRLRDLSQNIYDIGDEVAAAIDNVGQAMADWDDELVTDCLLELEVLIAEVRPEIRADLVELNGLRQALISGVRAGSLSNERGTNPWRARGAGSSPHPGRTLSFRHRPPGVAVASSVNQGVRGLAFAAAEGADSGDAADSAANTAAAASPAEQRDSAPAPGIASTATWQQRLREGSDQLIVELTKLQDWVVEQTELAVKSHPVLLPQVYAKAQATVVDTVAQWRELVAQQPGLAKSMRGEAPPEFLQERARINAVVARVKRRRGGTAV